MNYTHDCSKCIYLGSTVTENNKDVDMYIHLRESLNELIIRYSSNGPDYGCIPTNDPFQDAYDNKYFNIYKTAFCRALDKGIINGTKSKKYKVL